jgi:hypothetical protein
MVSYETESGDRMNFKKFYEFIVSKPFEIHPHFPLIEKNSFNNDNKLKSNFTILFEAQIENITSNVLFMSNVDLLASTNDDVKIEKIKTNKNPLKININNNLVNDFTLMRPRESKQYLFKVTFNRLNDDDELNRPLTVGKLDIGWCNSLGERGHLQTHPLSQTVKLFKFRPNKTI